MLSTPLMLQPPWKSRSGVTTGRSGLRRPRPDSRTGRTLEWHDGQRKDANEACDFNGIVRSTCLIDEDGVFRKVWDAVKVRKKRKDGTVDRHVDHVEVALRELG